jgi:hypothetical protein
MVPRFVYGWNVTTGAWLLRAVVGPVGEVVAASVDRVLREAEVDAVIEDLDAACAPPWCVHGEIEAADWAEAEERVRGWHFT